MCAICRGGERGWSALQLGLYKALLLSPVAYVFHPGGKKLTEKPWEGS